MGPDLDTLIVTLKEFFEKGQQMTTKAQKISQHAQRVKAVESVDSKNSQPLIWSEASEHEQHNYVKFV